MKIDGDKPGHRLPAIVTKLFQQLVSCFLALCFAGAGAVGTNPLLHQWVEHGGHGPQHAHGDGRWHAHVPECSPTAAVATDDCFRDFYKVPAAPTPAKTPAHEHHSLAQLMVNGLVDQPLALPLLTFAPLTFITHRFPANTPCTAFDWDAQTASRGPPPAQG